MSCSSQPVAQNLPQDIAADVNFLVQKTIDATKNVSDSDVIFRHWRDRVGRRLSTGGVLTFETLKLAQKECQAYWSRVTPSHVSLLSRDLLKESNSKWDSLSNLLKRIQRYAKQHGVYKHHDCWLTVEDIIEVEKRCREKARDTPKDLPSVCDCRYSQISANAHVIAEPSNDATEIIAGVPSESVQNSSTEKTRRIFDTLRCADTQPYTLEVADVDETEGRRQEHLENRAFLQSPGPLPLRQHRLKIKTTPLENCDNAPQPSTQKDDSQSGSAHSTSTGRPGMFRRRLQITRSSSDLLAKSECSAASTVRESSASCSHDVPATLHEESFVGAVEDIASSSSGDSAPTRRKVSSSGRYVRTQRKPSNVQYLLQKLLDKSGACRDARKTAKDYMKMLEEECIGRPISEAEGRTFTKKDMENAWAMFEEAYRDSQHLHAVESSSDAGSGSSSDVIECNRGGRRCRQPGRGQGRGRNRKSEALADSESDALSGEENVDRERAGPPDCSSDVWSDVATSVDDFDKLDDDYPAGAWELLPVLPGHDGFNARACAVMRKTGVGAAKLLLEFDAHAACPPLQPHQESVKFLLHPRSPVTRLLIDHPTGSGKTREMIVVLDNFFFDPRPKVPIFPKEAVCRNFYEELLRWPSRYRDYFACERPEDAYKACGRRDWRQCRSCIWPLEGFRESQMQELRASIRDVLEMKNMFFNGRVNKGLRKRFRRKHPGEHMPIAPLRALGYVSAGGCFSVIGESEMPLSALMKIGYKRGDDNVYSNKVVLMDEAHNLVRTQTQYAPQLERLRKLLFEAKNLTLAGFTGTPILNEPNEGRQLLDIIKGARATGGDEGFLSSFPMRPQPLFPKSLPRGVPDEVLTLQRRRQLVKKVALRGEAFKVYDWKLSRERLPSRRLRAYCNLCVYFGSYHDGKGTKTRVLADPQDCCPKIFEIAQAVAESPQKSIILISQSSGYRAMVDLMRQVAERAAPPFRVATMDNLSDFNNTSNFRGETFRVLVADAAQCSEGVSFLNVRRTFLADVPASPSAFIQQCGRAIRMYGHRDLPQAERDVTTHLYVAVLPKWLRSSALACWAMRSQRQRKDFADMEKQGKKLVARLNRVGIKSLTQLKAKLDKFASAKQEQGMTQDAQNDGMLNKSSLSPSDVAEFFESIGLATEAELLQKTFKREEPPEDSYDPSSQFAPDGKVAAFSWAIGLLSKLVDDPRRVDPLLHSKDFDRERRSETDQMLRRLCESDHVAPVINKISSVLTEEQTGGFSHWTHGQIQCLQHELLRLKSKEEAAPSRPRGLTRAVQELHAARSAEDSSLNLGISTADEEALEQLAAKSKEFVSALADLRMRAVDHELFQSLADPIEEDANDEVFAESEASDLEKELDPDDREFVMPKGWRSELVERGRRKLREFVNLEGKRYKNTKEMRAHLMQLQRRDAGIAANRMRLRERQAPLANPCTAETVEANRSLPSTTPAEFSRPSSIPTARSSAAESEHRRLAGRNILVHSLVTLAQYNGRKGFLVEYLEEKGRWRCRLDDGLQVNLKPENFKFLDQARTENVSMKEQLETIDRATHREVNVVASDPSDEPPEKMMKCAGDDLPLDK